jgi:starvation-inducible outer membrane lipoprotein
VSKLLWRLGSRRVTYSREGETRGFAEIDSVELDSQGKPIHEWRGEGRILITDDDGTLAGKIVGFLNRLEEGEER